MIPCMDHVAVEQKAQWDLQLNMIKLTALSVSFGLRPPSHGGTDVTHGLRLVLLMILSEVDVILLQ